MKILLTGGGGYLGTTLLRTLIDAQHKVHVLDRFDHGTQPLLSAVGRAQNKVEVFAGDVSDLLLMQEAALGCDAIIHLAGIVGYPACDANRVDASTTNVGGTRVVCDVARGRPLLFASTGSTYGHVPTGLATELHPISPLTLYGRTKATGEALVAQAGGVSLRLATLFGLSPRMRWDLLPHDFARTACQTGRLTLYEGHARRAFLHVEDAAAAFLEVLEVWDAAPGLFHGQVYNVGRDSGTFSKRAVAGMVQTLTGCQLVEGPGSDPDQRDYKIGFEKVHQALPAWARKPALRLSQALPQVVRWARGWK